jgi:hypothetical protein
MAESAQQAQEILRSTGLFSWYLIPFLAFIIYVYATEVERKKWNIILAGLAFYGLEWLFEIINAIWFHVSGYSAVWVTPGSTAYLPLIGLSIEISMMFAIAGVIFAKLLPEDRKMKILGINNRWALALGFSAFCVFVEILLNQWGVLVWNYSWWNWPNFYLIFLIGYLPYYVLAFTIHDMASMKKKIAIVSGIWLVDLVCIVVFMGFLDWI